MTSTVPSPSDKNPPARTLREALVAELLGELDALLKRVEALPGEVERMECSISSAAAALAAGADQYRLAVTAFTEEAKRDLSDYLEQRAAAVAAHTEQAQRVTAERLVRQALEAEVLQRLEALASRGGRSPSNAVLSKLSWIACGAGGAVVAGLLLLAFLRLT